MGSSTEDEWHDGWRLQWDAGADLDSDAASAVLRAFARLTRWRRRSPRSEAWKQITHTLEHHEAKADRLEAADPERADAHRQEVERIKRAIDAGKTERQILKLLEKAARAALVAHWGDREDLHKQTEAVMRLHLLGCVNLREEERIDREFRKAHPRPKPSGTLAKRAERIVQRVMRR